MMWPEPQFELQTEHQPEPENIYVIGLSGGKDSVAAWIYLTMVLKLPRVICVFADTGHESELTYDYLDYLQEHHGMILIRIQATLGEFADERELSSWKICIRLRLIPSDIEPWFLRAEHDSRELYANGKRSESKNLNKVAERMFDKLCSDLEWRSERLDMERLAVLKRRFPTGTRRFCTTFLKLLPQRNWLNRFYKTLEAHEIARVIRVSGVRAEESEARAGHNPWQWDKYMGSWMWLPIHKYTHQAVFDLHDEYGVQPNPLYKMGCGRVGCFPCINARKGEIKAIHTRTNALVQLAGMEKRVATLVGKPAMSFFSNDRTPERFHSQMCEQSGKSFPTAEDVIRWATDSGDSPGQMLMFEEDSHEDSHSCSSIYGLCE